MKHQEYYLSWLDRNNTVNLQKLIRITNTGDARGKCHIHTLVWINSKLTFKKQLEIPIKNLKHKHSLAQIVFFWETMNKNSNISNTYG